MPQLAIPELLMNLYLTNTYYVFFSPYSYSTLRSSVGSKFTSVTNAITFLVFSFCLLLPLALVQGFPLSQEV